MTGRDMTAWELLAIAFLAVSFLVYQILPQCLHCVALFWLVIPPFLLFFALAEQGQGVVTRLLKHPSLQWLGGISLEIYLLHMLVLRIANSLLAGLGIEEGWPMVMSSLGLLVLVAWLTKIFFVDKIYASLIKYVI
jgi:peptidoglycan/LPS O-acetylase OafA/YrhL